MVPSMPPLNIAAPSTSSASGAPITTGAKYFGPPATIAAAATPLLWIAVAVVAFMYLKGK